MDVPRFQVPVPVPDCIVAVDCKPVVVALLLREAARIDRRVPPTVVGRSGLADVSVRGAVERGRVRAPHSLRNRELAAYHRPAPMELLRTSRKSCLEDII